jgi:hypothetical protein
LIVVVTTGLPVWRGGQWYLGAVHEGHAMLAMNAFY